MSEKYLDLSGLTRYDGKLKTYIGANYYTQAQVQALIQAVKTIQIEVVQSLPPVSEGQTNVIYLVPKSQSETNNIYYEYVFTGSAYEKIGDTAVDLSDYYTKTQADALLANKVDKVSGKGLSTNDFTDALLTKLNGIASGAEVNVQANWSTTDSTADSFIQNKPTALSQFTNDITTSISNSEIDALFS